MPTTSADSPGIAASVDMAKLRSAAEPSYAGDWALFCDYTAATGQPTLPTTPATLARFLTDVPGRATTQARRIAAIAAAHRNTGHLPHRTTPVSDTQLDLHSGPSATELIAACPTRGWPDGFTGRRDAYLLVLVRALALTHHQAREITPPDLACTTTNTNQHGLDQRWAVRNLPVPVGNDPRGCPTCALVRWLEILGIADGLGRGSARMHLSATHATTATDTHRHALADTPRWRSAAQLLPAIDRHGWIEDFQALSTRAIHTRLARAETRAQNTTSHRHAPDHSAQPEHPTHATTTARAPRDLDEVLALLDQVANDADKLNAHIATLLSDNPSPRPDAGTDAHS